MENTERHQLLLDEIHDTYIRKNHDYGDSFTESCRDWGIAAGVIRIGDKYNRLRTLARTGGMVDESLRDTLLDMANYAIMTAMWMDQKDGASTR